MSDRPKPTYIPRHIGAVHIDQASGNLTLHFVRRLDPCRGGVSSAAAAIADLLRDDLRALIAQEDAPAPGHSEPVSALTAQCKVVDGVMVGSISIDPRPAQRQGELRDDARQGCVDRILDRLRQFAAEEAARPQKSVEARLAEATEQVQELLTQMVGVSQAHHVVSIMQTPDPRWLAEEVFKHLTQ